jgi:hypothetical protein
MTVRGFTPKTQHAYIRAVRKFTFFLGCSPDMATAEELRCYQLHQLDHLAVATTMNATAAGRRVLFTVTLATNPERPPA